MIKIECPVCGKSGQDECYVKHRPALWRWKKTSLAETNVNDGYLQYADYTMTAILTGRTIAVVRHVDRGWIFSGPLCGVDIHGYKTLKEAGVKVVLKICLVWPLEHAKQKILRYN